MYGKLLPGKTHLIVSKQLTKKFIKFCTFKMFRPAKIKVKVVRKCSAFIAIIKSLVKELTNILIKLSISKTFLRVGLSVCDEWCFYGFQLKV